MLSDDGRHWWDGTAWQLVSDDGLWRWDGRNWLPLQSSATSGDVPDGSAPATDIAASRKHAEQAAERARKDAEKARKDVQESAKKAQREADETANKARREADETAKKARREADELAKKASKDAESATRASIESQVVAQTNRIALRQPVIKADQASTDQTFFKVVVISRRGEWMIVSPKAEWWWTLSKWEKLVATPAELAPTERPPKSLVTKRLASRAAVGELKKLIAVHGTLDLAVAAATGTSYPMHPMGAKENAQLLQTLLAGEKVLSQCVGMKGQTLVVTDRKVLIIKTGWMAGSTLGAKVTAFDYRTITSVEVRTGPVMGAFSISSGGVAQRDRTYWGMNPDDAYKSPDAIPIAKVQAPDFQKAAALIRELAASSSAGTLGSQRPAPRPQADPIDQLKRLAELRDAGVLSDEEFEIKKAELLARM